MKKRSFCVLYKRWSWLSVLLALLFALLEVSCVEATTTIFSDGFESGLGSWGTIDNDPYGVPAYWGIVDSAFGGEGVHGGTHKAYCAGVGYNGTTATPTYANEMKADLSHIIDLTGVTNATLSFWYKIPTLDSPYDTCTVFIDETPIWTRDTRQTAWTQVSLSLQVYVGGAHVLKFEFESDNTVTRKGWYLDDILITDAATPGPPLDNDDFLNAEFLKGATGLINGNNFNATFEGGEATSGFAGTNSVWYAWTAMTNGLVTFSTAGSDLDALVCVYTGNSVDGLVLVGSDDNGASLLSFDALAGMTYSIQIRGATNRTGRFQLSWDQPAGIGDDLLPDIVLLADPSRAYLYGWYIDRNEPTQPGRTLLRVTTATFNSGAGPLELVGSSLSPDVYQRIYRTDGSFHDRYAGTFTFHPTHGHLHFDNWLNFQLRQVLPDGGVGDVVAAGHKTSVAIIDDDPVDLTLPGAAPHSQYGGGLVQGLSVGWSDVYGANLPDQWIDVTGVAAGNYWLEAAADPANSILELNKSNNVSRILVDLTLLGPQPVVNDFFANATTIKGISASLRGSNTGATREANEPKIISETDGGASLWYRWVAPSNMLVTVTTDGSSFDTVLGVFTGSNIGSLTKIASDDDSGLGKASLVTFTASAGVSYKITVDGYGGQMGNLVLNVNPAWNDNLENCVIIAGMNGTASGSTRGSTRQADEPLHAGVSGNGSIWYCWTAPTDGPYTFDTIGSDFDTLLAIYTGASFPLTPIASDNDSGSFNTSRVLFQAQSNVTYQIAVDGVNGAQGAVQLRWTGPQPPAVVFQPLSVNLVAGSTARFNVGVSGSTPMGFQWRHFGTNVVDEEGRIFGSTTAVLTLGKVLPEHAGGYTVVITNIFGSVTSAPATLIVLDNPRAVYIEQVTGGIGGTGVVPVQMQAVGDEQSVSFSLLFDPSLIAAPRLVPGADSGAAQLLADATEVANGRLGIRIIQPAGQSMVAGRGREILRVLFDINGAAADGVVTPLGFADEPVSKAGLGTNGAPVTILFAAGSLTLQKVSTTIRADPLPNGQLHLLINGLAGRSYLIERSTNLWLPEWEPLSTNETSLSGVLELIDPRPMDSAQRFYRTRFQP